MPKQRIEKIGFKKDVEERILRTGVVSASDQVYYENYWRKFPSMSDERGRPSNVARNRALQTEYQMAKQNKKGRKWRNDVIEKIYLRQTFKIFNAKGEMVWEQPLKKNGKLSEESIRKIYNSRMK